MTSSVSSEHLPHLEHVPRSLHVSNIANVAYGYCKILTELGYEVALRCHDMYHLMSQPEWDDLELDPCDFHDENNFFNNTADFGNYERPAWFIQDHLLPRQTSPRLSVSTLLREAWRHLPETTKERLRPLILSSLSVGSRLRGVRKQENLSRTRSATAVYSELCRRLSQQSIAYGQHWRLNKRDLLRYRSHTEWLAKHGRGNDVVFAYAASPIYAMLFGELPYVAVEIGTIRDLPFDGTAAGKSIALAYRLANHVIVTNPDNKRAIGALNIKNYSFCPHPVDEDVYRPQRNETLRAELKARYQAEFFLLAPARQNWKLKGNDYYFRAFARLVREGASAVLLICGWGQEVQRSKRLCADLGIGHRTLWLSPLSERGMIRYYRAVDVVLDQFRLGVFGLITPKAMACGRPVLTSYDASVHGWCFAAHPPVVNCWTEEDIFAAMRRFYRAPEKVAEIGLASRDWILKYYSKAAVAHNLVEAMRCAQENFLARQPYDWCPVFSAANSACQR